MTTSFTIFLRPDREFFAISDDSGTLMQCPCCDKALTITAAKQLVGNMEERKINIRELQKRYAK